MKAVLTPSGSNHSGSKGNKQSSPSTDFATRWRRHAPQAQTVGATQWMTGACQPADFMRRFNRAANRREKPFTSTVITAFGRAAITSSTSLSARRDRRG